MFFATFVQFLNYLKLKFNDKKYKIVKLLVCIIYLLNILDKGL